MKKDENTQESEWSYVSGKPMGREGVARGRLYHYLSCAVCGREEYRFPVLGEPEKRRTERQEVIAGWLSFVSAMAKPDGTHFLSNEYVCGERCAGRLTESHESRVAEELAAGDLCTVAYRETSNVDVIGSIQYRHSVYLGRLPDLDECFRASGEARHRILNGERHVNSWSGFSVMDLEDRNRVVHGAVSARPVDLRHETMIPFERPRGDGASNDSEFCEFARWLSAVSEEMVSCFRVDELAIGADADLIGHARKVDEAMKGFSAAFLQEAAGKKSKMPQKLIRQLRQNYAEIGDMIRDGFPAMKEASSGTWAVPLCHMVKRYLDLEVPEVAPHGNSDQAVDVLVDFLALVDDVRFSLSDSVLLDGVATKTLAYLLCRKWDDRHVVAKTEAARKAIHFTSYARPNYSLRRCNILR